MRGIRRSIGVAPRRVQPVPAERLAAMLAGLPDTLAGKRDRAGLALGFAGAFRRLIRRSKTDQEGQGAEVPILRGTRLRSGAAVQA